MEAEAVTRDELTRTRNWTVALLTLFLVVLGAVVSLGPLFVA